MSLKLLKPRSFWPGLSLRAAKRQAILFGCFILAGSSTLAAPGEYAECRGEIIAAETGQSLSFEELAHRLQAVDVVLFGEVHGVSQHARASACVVTVLADGERPAGLVMEMFSTGDQPAIDLYRKDNPEHAAGLASALDWWKRGWPAFESWLPLVDRAFGLRVDLIGGDIGASALETGARLSFERRLGSDLAAVRKAWTAAMERAHCGLIDRKEAARLGERQIKRDLSMADQAIATQRRLSNRTKKSAAVLVHAGRGHVRKDRSLYRALIRQTENGEPSGLEVVSIGALTETEAPGTQDRGAHDYFWITGDAGPGGKACDVFGQAGISEADTGGRQGEGRAQ